MNTKSRVYGSDAPFNNWIRNNNSISATKGFGMQDVDCLLNIWHKHSEQGNRDKQHMMMIETKVYTSPWTPQQYQDRNVSQLDTLSKLHMTCCGVDKFSDERGEKTLCNHGVSFLVMDADTPAESKEIYWGRFKWVGKKIEIFNQLHWHKLDGVNHLEDLLKFNLHPSFGLLS